MSREENLKTTISGEFVKIVFADQVDIILQRNLPNRPAARFNRRGQDALYLSVDEDSARVAMKKYVSKSDPPRVLIRYMIQSCQLINLGHVDARELHLQSRSDWKDAIERGGNPPSWQVADKLRESNEVGLIDPSRQNPKLWHVTLLRWNEPNAPQVTMVGQAMPITV